MEDAVMETLSHLETAEEAVMILRGEHPGWDSFKGDRIENAETFLRRVGQDFNGAEVFADDLDKNRDSFSELLGISPDRVFWMANRVRDGIRSRQWHGGAT